VWVTDGQDNAALPQRGAGAGGRGRGEAPTGPIGPRPGSTMGHQVFKFSPEGKVLLTLGKAGGAAAPDSSTRPTTSSPRPTATSSWRKDTAPATTAC